MDIFSNLLKDHFPTLEFYTWNYCETGHGKGTLDIWEGQQIIVERFVDERNIKNYKIFTTSLKNDLRRIGIYDAIDADIAQVLILVEQISN